MENDHYFGEWVEYRDDAEKCEAYQYLELWKKFIIRKLVGLEFVTEQFTDHPYLESFSGIKSPSSTLGIKIHLKGKKPENVLSLADSPPIL